MTRREPSPEDRTIGARIRTRRIAAGISQTQLAAHLGITFQQVQKYEKGTNRVAASRLNKIGEKLGEDPKFFLGDGNASEASADLYTMLAQPQMVRVCRALEKIEDREMRWKFVHLIEKVGAAQGKAKKK